MRPTPAEYNPYFERYISLVLVDKVVPILVSQVTPLRELLRNLSDDRAGFRYEPGKWSVRESLGHLIDTERVFGYRALWAARGCTEALPGFEQNDFTVVAKHDSCAIGELVDEFTALRESHIHMFNHLPTEAWARSCTAGGNPLSVRAAAFIMAGHLIHHTAIFQERYGL
ncbi:MAG: DinB family protein [Gemmatimonadales bacterium]